MIRRLAGAAVLVALGACGTTGTLATPAGGTRTETLPPAPPPPPLPEHTVACAADVKQCADGSFVSRNPARDCAFDACPRETP